MSDDNEQGFEQDGLEWVQADEKDDAFQPGSGSGQAVVPASDSLPERVYLLPIHNRPFFRPRCSRW